MVTPTIVPPLACPKRTGGSMRGLSCTFTAVNFSATLVFLLALLNGCTNSSNEAFQRLMAQQKADEAAAREGALQEINSDKIMAQAFRPGICDSIFLCWHVKCRIIFKSLVIGMSERSSIIV
jgi:hypothetical protein